MLINSKNFKVVFQHAFNFQCHSFAVVISTANDVGGKAAATCSSVVGFSVLHMEKKLARDPKEFQRFLPDIGVGFVSDRVAVDGQRVSHMIHSQQDDTGISGWFFLGGDEDQEYMQDPKNFSQMTLNSITNLDPEVVSFLTYPPGSEVERGTDGRLSVVKNPGEEPLMVYMLPLDAGPLNLGQHWQTVINSRMLRRVDHGNLVLWRPQLTIWIRSFQSPDKTAAEKLALYQKHIAETAIDCEAQEQNDYMLSRYFLREANEDGAEQDAVYMAAFTDAVHIDISAYYDDNEAKAELDLFWHGLKPYQKEAAH